MAEAARPGPGGRHRRRHRRHERRLSPHQARLAGRPAARAPAADVGHHLARRRPDRAAARDREPDPARQVLGRALRRARGRDRATHRVPAARQPQPRPDRGAPHRAEARRLDGGDLRPRGRGDRAGRGQGAPPAARRRRSGRRGIHPLGRPGQPDRHHPGAGQGRQDGRRADRRALRGHRDRPSQRPGDGRRDRSRGRSPPRSWSTAPACGAAGSAAWQGSTCRCRPASISTS